jgi:hypothetical protein
MKKNIYSKNVGVRLGNIAAYGKLFQIGLLKTATYRDRKMALGVHVDV